MEQKKLKVQEKIDLIKRFITVQNKIKDDVKTYYSQKDEFLADIPKQIIILLFERGISQIQSILILIDNKKYIEACSILRNLFENSVFILYIARYPFEAKRWVEWGNMSFEEKQEYDNDKKKFNDFIFFLKKNDYNDLLKIVTNENWYNYKKFKEWFIRKKAFEKDEKNPDGMDSLVFDEFYYKLCKRVHPSILSVFHQNTQDTDQINAIINDVFYILPNVTYIFIEFFNGNMGNLIIKDYETLSDEMNSNRVI